MYKAFFGFNERPFKLVPDPAYFFLGPSHEEALAHLEFAVRQGEGFTLITGEVGTGKTTLCRRFLENLDETTEVAYIFNPVLGVLELLKSINEEYGISSKADLPRELINRLNAFLLDMKARNRSVILLIDEAQNLSSEVLEQLRLLSNLETTRSKLLQIILVGQPELNDLLSSYKLRQLGQRISLSYQLLPLTRPETEQYIVHRISIASNRPETIFSSTAMREIHAFSGGIPRLINTACDRSLLVAFSQNEHHVSGQIARSAVKELRHHQKQPSFRDRFTYSWLWILIVIGFFALIGLFAVPKMLSVNPPSSPISSELSRLLIKPITAPPVIREPAPLPLHVEPLPPTGAERGERKPAPSGSAEGGVPDEAAAPAPVSLLQDASTDRFRGEITLKNMNIVRRAKPRIVSQVIGSSPISPQTKPFSDVPIDSVTTNDLKQLLRAMDPEKSRRDAILAVLKLWAIEPKMQIDPGDTTDDLGYFRKIVGGNGLMVHRAKNDLALIAGMDLPAILAFELDGRTQYLVLSKWDNRTLVLTDGNRHISIISSDLLDSGWRWTYIPWKDFAGLDGTIPREASAETILTFKMLLRKMGFSEVPLTADYGDLAKQAVEKIQARGGIPIDGVVGPATKIIIYNDLTQYWAPRIGANANALG